ncbi:amidohydrolase [Bacillus shivajii]|uniref:amidohydrolase n=1 Tax=Bacillus shivajii TaxID=1983719 RepID=UPI001CF93ADB|nr:amidohydrolase [Bacillus shivajii]UCZ54812.1 amidohydrolase [Bacillus shivajii]
MKLLIHSVTIVTMNENDDIVDGYVVVEDGKFKEVTAGYPNDSLIDQADETINGQGKWLMPGFVNTHGHLGSSLLRGAGDDMPLMDWLQNVMWPNEQRLTKEDVEKAAKLAVVEMIKSGTTTFLDMYHLHMEQMAELTIESNMRAVLCRGMIGLCSEEEQYGKINESVSLHKHFHGENAGKLHVALAPHAPYTCPPAFLEKVVDAAEKHNMWIHTHVAETKREVLEHKEKYNETQVSHLNKLGLFDVPCLIAHGVHLNDEEQHILSEKNVSVSHNPMSNLKLGSGIANIPELINKGINVAIGTDSTASNNNLSMVEELRFASLIHKGTYQDPTVTQSKDILKMATVNGAKALQLEDIGFIQEGSFADFILINPDRAHLTPWNKERVHSHLVYALKDDDISDVFVQGKQLMKDRELLFLDEQKIVADAQAFLF